VSVVVGSSEGKMKEFEERAALCIEFYARAAILFNFVFFLSVLCLFYQSLFGNIMFSSA
jgi:hypothetical protein